MSSSLSALWSVSGSGKASVLDARVERQFVVAGLGDLGRDGEVDPGADELRLEAVVLLVCRVIWLSLVGSSPRRICLDRFRGEVRGLGLRGDVDRVGWVFEALAAGDDLREVDDWAMGCFEVLRRRGRRFIVHDPVLVVLVSSGVELSSLARFLSWTSFELVTTFAPSPLDFLVWASFGASSRFAPSRGASSTMESAISSATSRSASSAAGSSRRMGDSSDDEEESGAWLVSLGGDMVGGDIDFSGFSGLRLDDRLERLGSWYDCAMRGREAQWKSSTFDTKGRGVRGHLGGDGRVGRQHSSSRRATGVDGLEKRKSVEVRSFSRWCT